MTTLSLDEQIDTLRKTLRVLFPDPGEVAELRMLFRGRKGGVSTYFRTDDAGLSDMAQQAAVLDADATGNLYFGLNPRTPALLGSGESGKAEHVTRRRWLLVDCDPTRAAGHADDATSKAEKAAAKDTLGRVVRWLTEQGWPAPLVADSGNGYHALYRVDLEAESTLVGAVLDALAERFGSPACKVDTTLRDAPRICRLYGTTNRKGTATAERPHRRSKLVPAPPPVQVPPAKLLAVAKLASGPSPAAKPTPVPKPSGTTRPAAPRAGGDAADQARRWLAKRPAAVEGEHGDEHTTKTVWALVHGFGLSADTAVDTLADWNAGCSPPWDEDGLRQKAERAEAKAERDGGRGSMVRCEADAGSKPGRGPSAHDTLVEIAEGGADLWTTPGSEPYATVEVDGIRRHLSVMEGAFGDWLAGAYRVLHGRLPAPDAIDQACKSVARLARLSGVRHEVFVRVGWSGDGPDRAVWVDLCDDTWRAVRITAAGWEVVAQPDVRFRRSRLLASLPAPEPGGSWNLLRPLANVQESDWPALLAFLVGCHMGPAGMLPVLCLHGAAGAGKSTLMHQVERLVDPRTDAAGVGVPASEVDLLLAAEGSWLQRFNNASGVTQHQSDLLCGLVAGAALAKRALYSNKDVVVVQARRPVVMNGVAIVPTAADLLSRCLPVQVVPPRSPDDADGGEGVVRRRTDRELADALERVRPAVLGCLYAAVAAALRGWDATPDSPHRLADFARWASAAEPALGVLAGAVRSAIDSHADEAKAAAVEASMLAGVLRGVVEDRGGAWEATAAEWLEACNKAAPTGTTAKKGWPSTPVQWSQQVGMLQPALPAAGLVATKLPKCQGGRRPWRVALLADPAGREGSALKGSAVETGVE